MVFHGKLSQGCSSCRKVHVKCDGGKPQCARCVRLKKSCTGPREPLDLMFRHTTFATTEEASLKKRDDKQCVILPSNDNNNASFWDQLLPVLATSKDDLALAFFYTRTLENLPEADHARYLHLHLSSLYMTNTNHSALQLAALAISHATYNRDARNSIQAIHTSRKYYVQAVSAINDAIQDPVVATSDQTLYAVLLLCGYETTVCDAQSVSAWGCHVDGAIALLRLRGKECLRRSFSRRIYYFIRRSSILSHMQTARPMDPFFTHLTEDHHRDENVEDLLLSNTVHVPNLQSLANGLLVHDYLGLNLGILDLMHSAQKLDENLVSWANSIPSSWRYILAPAVHSRFYSKSANSEFNLLKFHIYHDVFVGRVWNLYRTSRLIVQSVILRAMSWLSRHKSSFQAPLNAAYPAEITRDLVNDICSSVPFLLGFGGNIQDSAIHDLSPQYQNLWPQNSMNLVNTTMNGKFSLIWPLHVASSSLLAPEAQRDWIKAQLHWLGDVGNISQASLVATRESQTLLGGSESFRFDCV